MTDVKGGVAARAFRLLLTAYPREFRHTYGADMELLFAERYAESRRAGEAAAFCARTAVSVVGAGVAERWARVRVARRRKPLHSRRLSMNGTLHDAAYALRLL